MLWGDPYVDAADLPDCPKCDGTGLVPCPDCVTHLHDNPYRGCTDCLDTGLVSCDHCEGTGRMTPEEAFEAAACHRADAMMEEA